MHLRIQRGVNILETQDILTTSAIKGNPTGSILQGNLLNILGEGSFLLWRQRRRVAGVRHLAVGISQLTARQTKDNLEGQKKRKLQMTSIARALRLVAVYQEGGL